MKKVIGLLVAVFAIGLLTACGDDNQDSDLVGIWGTPDREVWTLNADGTGVEEGDEFEWSTRGGTLTMTFDDGDTESLNYSIDGDTLIIAYPEADFEIQLERIQ